MPDTTANVGDKVKKLRESQSLSLEEVAKRSGISAATLAMIEDQELSPPLGNIVSLAKAFDVPVGDIFGDSGDSPFCIVRSDDQATVSRFSAAHSESCGYTYKGLGQQKRNRQMEPFLVTLNPVEGETPLTNQHIGEEFIFVLEGEVEVSLSGHRDILAPGDSIYYDSNAPHIISCHGDTSATILAVIYAKEEMIIL